MQQSSRQSGMRINDIFKQLQAHCQLAFSDQRVSLHHKIDQWFSKWFDFRFERIPPENQSRRIFLTETELYQLGKTLVSAAEICDYFTEEKSAAYPLLKQIADSLLCFPEISRHIDSILDKFGNIKDNASTWITTIAEKNSFCIKQCQRHDAESNITL